MCSMESCSSSSFFLFPSSLLPVYSFTGASVPPHLKTVAIPLVDDQSGFGEPGLREDFTRAAHGPLHQRQQSGGRGPEHCRCDAESASIGTVSDAPSVVQQGEQVSKRRVTMTVRFAFQDMKLRKKVWEKTFSNWGDYDSGGGMSQRKVGIAGSDPQDHRRCVARNSVWLVNNVPYHSQTKVAS